MEEYTKLLFQEQDKKQDKISGKPNLSEEQYNKRIETFTNIFKKNETDTTNISIKTKVGKPIDKGLQLNNVDIRNAFNKIAE